MSIGWSQATAEVPDADRITPPFVPARDGHMNPVSITIDMNAGFPAGERREQLSRHRRRGASRQSLSHRAWRWPRARGARLRAGLDAGRRQRAGCGAVHGNARRQDVRLADGAAADGRRSRHAARAAGDHLHRRHVGFDGRRVHRAGARRAVHGPRPAAGGRSLQRHRIQFDQHFAVHRAHALRRGDARAGKAVRRPAARARRNGNAARARVRAGGTSRNRR